MLRTYGAILALCATISQIGLGALPAWMDCLCAPAAVETTCCEAGCCGDSAGKAGKADAPADGGLDHCVCIKRSEHPTVNLRNPVEVDRPVFGPAPEPFVYAPAPAILRSAVTVWRADESPPHLLTWRTIRLVL